MRARRGPGRSGRARRLAGTGVEAQGSGPSPRGVATGRVPAAARVPAGRGREGPAVQHPQHSLQRRGQAIQSVSLGRVATHWRSCRSPYWSASPSRRRPSARATGAAGRRRPSRRSRPRWGRAGPADRGRSALHGAWACPALMSLRRPRGLAPLITFGIGFRLHPPDPSGRVISGIRLMARGRITISPTEPSAEHLFDPRSNTRRDESSACTCSPMARLRRSARPAPALPRSRAGRSSARPRAARARRGRGGAAAAPRPLRIAASAGGRRWLSVASLALLSFEVRLPLLVESPHAFVTVLGPNRTIVA